MKTDIGDLLSSVRECSNCGNTLPLDSEFCQCCGIKLKKFIQTDSPKSNETEQLLSEKLKRQKEEELARFAQVQHERNIAIQKRIAANEAAEKKKKIIKAIIIVVVIAIISVFIVKEAQKSAYNGELRNIGTDKMEASFTNVYADVVSFEPIYTIEESKFKGNVQIGYSQTASVICKCTTVEGTTFWLKIPSYTYTGTIEYRGEDTTDGYDDQYFDEPIRVRGRMTTFGKAVDNAPAHLENTLILSSSQSTFD